VIEVLREVRKRTVIFANGNDVVVRLPADLDYVESNVANVVRNFAGAAANLPIFGQLVEQVAQRAESFVSYSSDLKMIGTKYSHVCPVLHLLPEGLKVCPDGRAGAFCAINEKKEPNSLINNHSILKYFDGIKAAAELRSDGLDDSNTITKLRFKRDRRFSMLSFLHKPWSSSTGELEFAVNENGINKFAESVNEPQKAASIVSFNGNSTNGKSFLIKKLQGDMQHRSPTVYENAGDLEGATSGNIALWPWRHGWLMDCEGTNGTSMPAVMPSSYRKIAASISSVGLNHRSEAVRRCIPPFALLTSNVFCFVTREGPNSLQAYNDVKDFARNAWSGVASAVRPSLVVIQNQVGSYKDVQSIASTTKRFLEHISKDKDESLSEMFTSIHFVQMPSCDRDLFVQTIGKTMADVFDKRLENLAELLEQLVTQHQEKQAYHEALVTQGLWLRLVEAVVEAVQCKTPVNMTSLLTTMQLPDNCFFSDVWTSFSFLLSKKVFQFEDVEGMIERFLRILDSVELHAATLMARHDVDKQIGVDGFTDKFQELWKDFVERLARSIPCCALLESASAPFNVCCQPRGGHDGHCSHYKQEKANAWWKFWGNTTSVSVRWPGDHVASPRIEQRLQELEKNVFTVAHRISCLMHGSTSGLEGDRQEGALGRLRTWKKDAELPDFVVDNLRYNWTPQMRKCYGCASNLRRSVWRRSVFFAPDPCLDVCKRCSQRLADILPNTANEFEHTPSFSYYSYY
jgi:hypothetical protein